MVVFPANGMSVDKQRNNNGKRTIKPRWKKGQSGNPKGRPPKGRCIPDILARLSGAVLPASLRAKLEKSSGIPIEQDATRLEIMCECVYWCALRGEPWAVIWVSERSEGKVKDVLKMEGGQVVEVVTKVVRRNAETSN